MNFTFYLSCFIGGIFGISANILFVKIPTLKKSAKVGNASFVVSDYFKNDWLSIVTSVFVVFISMYIIDEIVKSYPVVSDWIKWFFIFIGYTGQSIFQQFFNKTAEIINQTINTKTDIADNVNQPAK